MLRCTALSKWAFQFEAQPKSASSAPLNSRKSAIATPPHPRTQLPH